jgi:uncharacterized membrane protein
MTKIAESIGADVPYEDVPELAYRYLDSFPSNERDGSHFTMRAWIANVMVEREVMLKMVPVKTDPRAAVLDIRWRPVSGPYPSFKGQLLARRGDAHSCRLEIDGEYVPPGGIAGAAFDAVLGRRIAEEGVLDLLERFRKAFEQLHAEGVSAP